MLEAGGRPIIEHILRHLAACGVGEAVVNLHFLPEAIRGSLGDGAGVGLRIRYSEEPVLLGTAGALRRAAGLLRGDGPIIVQYGDVVTDMDLRPVIEDHRRRGPLATLVLHRRARSNSAVRLKADGRISAFLERPSEAERAAIADPWVNSGICVLDPAVLDRIPEGVADLPRDVFIPLVPTGRLLGVPLAGYRCAVDSPERLEELRAAFREGRCRIDGPSAKTEQEHPT
jgi:NDP-sugar pyrophosphorylase family protein